MFLIQRWDNVIIERTMVLERALEIAEQESVTRNTRIDVMEHWIEPSHDDHVASYRNGQVIPIR